LQIENDTMSEVFQNKVAESGIITLDLEQYYPKGDTAVFDMKDHLFMGLILKEKDFREALKNMDWEIYRDKNVAVTCSADAIIPVWAYMLVGAGLLGNIAAADTAPFIDKRVVIKGCGEIPISEAAYLQITHQLRPVAKSIMYGEPCSTVPIYKKK
jgi:Protein of unknown function (DUF2480)